MLEKIKKVSNPLTIIAMFAGITETSGAIVLPLLDGDNQFIFLWFVMMFPSALVLLFFAILNWNHKALYAPSDYQDDSSFITMSKIKDSKIESSGENSQTTGIAFGDIIKLSKGL